MDKQKMIDDFCYEMMEVYADRDQYSRGKIIDLAKEVFEKVVNKNALLADVNFSLLDKIAIEILNGYFTSHSHPSAASPLGYDEEEYKRIAKECYRIAKIFIEQRN